SLTASWTIDSFLSEADSTALTFQLIFDTDGSSGTGTTIGGMPGIDEILTVNLSGIYPFEPQAGLGDASLTDVATPLTVPLAPPRVERIEAVVDADSGEIAPIPIRDRVEVTFGLRDLHLSAAEIPYAARAWADATPLDVDQTSTFQFTWIPLDSTTIE